MSEKIEIRGVIVPSMYDNAYFWPYIQRGVITLNLFSKKIEGDKRG